MRSSPSLPPSGYTRALPRPPRSRLPWTATAVATGTAAVAVAAVLALPGDRPPRSLTAGGGPTTGVAGAATEGTAGTPVAPGGPSPTRTDVPSLLPRTGTAARPPARTPARTPGHASGRASGRTPDAAPERAGKAAEPGRRPVRKPRRAARPAAVPAWARAECARRFPGDPVRRRFCAAALAGFRDGVPRR